MDKTPLILVFFLIILFFCMKMDTSYVPPDTAAINATNIGFVKPEHRLLKIFNTISGGSKIKLEGVSSRYIYNKNTIDRSVEERLTDIMKKLINTINHISQNDYYIKQIENVYAMISADKNQRYFIDFFVYDVRNYYTIRLIADIVIIDGEIYINYMNIQTGSNPTILNKYDVKFNDTGILFDGNMFKENIDMLLDSFYRQSFNVIGVKNSSLGYTAQDLTDVVSMNSLRNMYFPSSMTKDTINELEKKDLSGYVEMYLPENQETIKSPMFCNKYKVEWDSYGIPNETDITDKACFLNENCTIMTYNEPINAPGLFNNVRTDVTQYDWLLNKQTVSSSL